MGVEISVEGRTRPLEVPAVPRTQVRTTARPVALIVALVVSIPALTFVTAAPASSTLPDTSEPTLQLNHTLRTTPFAGSGVSMKDNEGSAYVPVDDSLWLADDNGRTLYEVNASTGELKRTLGPSALAGTDLLGGGPSAGTNRDRDLESMAYDAANDTLYAFSGNCCTAGVLPTAFRLTRADSGTLELDSYQPLPSGTDFTAAAWNPADGNLYVGLNGNLRTYSYTSNAVGAPFQIPSLTGILGMTFSADGADLYVVRTQTQMSRVDWATKRLEPGWTFDLARFGMLDTRAVELINDQFWISDGFDSRAVTDPLRDAVFVFDVPGSSDTPAPTASFTASQTSGQAPLTVTFTDTSTGNPTTRQWAFGDGETSTSPNPSHVYASAGTYTVTLTEKSAGGAATATQSIQVEPAPSPPPATSWSTTAASTGYPTIIRATLRNTETGDGVGNHPVVAQVKWYGTPTWRSVATDLTTNNAGAVSYRHRTNRAGYFRFVYAKTSALAGSTSAAVFVKVPTRLSARVNTHRPKVVRGRLTTAAGNRLSGERVALQRRYSGTKRWVRVDLVTSSRTGKVTSRQRPTRKAYYRWKYHESTTLDHARSKPVSLRS